MAVPAPAHGGGGFGERPARRRAVSTHQRLLFDRIQDLVYVLHASIAPAID